MRQKVVAGNWKMHGFREDVLALLQRLKHEKTSSVDMVVFPTFLHLSLAEEVLTGTLIQWGAQDIYPGETGAFTGEISGAMLREYGCRYVLVGHSERRCIFKEDMALVAEKCRAALQFGLQPILCVGETLAEREQSQAEFIIKKQLDSVIDVVGFEVFAEQALIAYEPVWAIGTGVTASPEQAQAMHAFIRSQLAQRSVEVAATARILYGGSVKADNAAALFAMPDIDGGLIGGASLVADHFLAIDRAASLY